MQRGRDHWIVFGGPRASWIDPSAGPIRTTNLFPSHGAVEGILRQIMGKWAVRWYTSEIRLLAMSTERLVETTNALKRFSSSLKRDRQMAAPITSEQRHTQRTQDYLLDVHYAVRSHMVLSSRAIPGEDTIPKFEAMFERRASKGQRYRSMYLGCSECYADYEVVKDPPPALDITQDLGIRYFDTWWDENPAKLYYVPLQVNHGVVRLPTWDEARAQGLSRRRRFV